MKTAQTSVSSSPTLAATEDLSGVTTPLIAEEKDYSTNVYALPPDATEVLFATKASEGKTTQELPTVPDVFRTSSSKPGVTSQPQTGAQSKPGNSVVVSAKSGKRWPLAIAAVVLLAAIGVAGIYKFGHQKSEISVNVEPSPESVLAISNSPTPESSVAPSPTLTAMPRSESISSTPTTAVAKVQPEEEGKKKTEELVNEKANPENNSTEIKKEIEPERKPLATPLPKEAATKEQPMVSVGELLQRGLSAQNSGRHQEALSEFHKALKQDPYNVNLYYLIGTSYHALGQLEQALAAYRKCTSGAYARVSAEHVKKLEKKVGKSKY